MQILFAQIKVSLVLGFNRGTEIAPYGLRPRRERRIKVVSNEYDGC